VLGTTVYDLLDFWHVLEKLAPAFQVVYGETGAPAALTRARRSSPSGWSGAARRAVEGGHRGPRDQPPRAGAQRSLGARPSTHARATPESRSGGRMITMRGRPPADVDPRRRPWLRHANRAEGRHCRIRFNQIIWSGEDIVGD
jgi:hypothetical protein